MSKTRASIRQPTLLPPPDKRRRRALPHIDEQLLERGLPIPHVEYLFAKHVGRDWRFDYCWPAFKVAYEREGSTWGRMMLGADGKQHRLAGGRHMRGAGADTDAEKYNLAATLGWVVIRGTSSTERHGQAIADLVAALKARGWKEPPC